MGRVWAQYGFQWIMSVHAVPPHHIRAWVVVTPRGSSWTKSNANATNSKRIHSIVFRRVRCERLGRVWAQYGFQWIMSVHAVPPHHIRAWVVVTPRGSSWTKSNANATNSKRIHSIVFRRVRCERLGRVWAQYGFQWIMSVRAWAGGP